MSSPSNIFEKFKFITSNYNILVLEDSKTLNNIIVKHLKNDGYNCFSAQNLKDAKEILSENTINFIILDINLPDGNGYELIKKYSNSNIKIIVITSQDDEQFRQLSFQNGIIDFIVKDKEFLNKLDEISLIIEKIVKNKQSTILIVEDSIIIQEQLVETLSNRSYKTLQTEGINQILHILENNDVDLILLDVNLKDGNGIEFLSKHKSIIIEKYKIPVIIVSGSNDNSIVREGLKAGAKDIIRKPYIVEELILKVDANIDYKRKQKENIHIQQMLKEYRNAIEESSIFFITDKHGFLKEVNDEFCNTTGYIKKELIGKPYTITRFDELDEKIYNEIWATIKNNKIWKGELKNKKKDGSFYWTHLTLKPILDTKNNLLECIGICKDITREKLLKNYVKEFLKKRQ